MNRWLNGAKGNTVKSKKEATNNIQTRTVLFVENTRGGSLAKRLREVEKSKSEMVGFKTKVVERVGTKLQHLLPNTNPWKGAVYGRINCIPCGQGGRSSKTADVETSSMNPSVCYVTL